jgi:uncharacterized membrane-anchored protein
MATMSADFSPERFWALSPEERAQRCRQMALLSEQLAATAGDGARADYLAIARQWRELADEMESLIHVLG